MKNYVKRFLSIAIVLLMVITMIPVQVFATAGSELITETVGTAEKVNLVLVDGQSNAAGNCGEMLDATVAMPDEGEAYIWVNGEAVDLNTYNDLSN